MNSRNNGKLLNVLVEDWKGTAQQINLASYK